jgi:AraC family transcriptional activator of pyochelin receptor
MASWASRQMTRLMMGPATGATLIDLTARDIESLESGMEPARNQSDLEAGRSALLKRFEHLQPAPMLRETRDLLARHPDIAAFEQLGGECHYRFDFANGQITGCGEICGVTQGIFVQLTDAESNPAWVAKLGSPDVMRFRIASEGSESFSWDGERSVTTDGPSALIVIEPPDQPPAQMVVTGRQKTVMVCADRGALQQLWQGRENELPAVVQAFLGGSLTQTVIRRLSLKSDLLRCLEDLQRCEHDGLARTLFFRSKALEIFCHALKLLAVDEGFGGTDASRVTSKGVLRAQQILKERFVTPPSLDDLAREVGLSRSSLCAGFRQILGQSVYDYINDLRMQHALALLAERNASITQIAYAVGYNYPSSFSVAVQRRFGATPRELRRRGAMPTM